MPAKPWKAFWPRLTSPEPTVPPAPATFSMTTAWPMQGDDPETDYYGYTFDVLSRANALSNRNRVTRQAS